MHRGVPSECPVISEVFQISKPELYSPKQVGSLKRSLVFGWVLLQLLR